MAHIIGQAIRLPGLSQSTQQIYKITEKHFLSPHLCVTQLTKYWSILYYMFSYFNKVLFLVIQGNDSLYVRWFLLTYLCDLIYIYVFSCFLKVVMVTAVQVDDRTHLLTFMQWNEGVQCAEDLIEFMFHHNRQLQHGVTIRLWWNNTIRQKTLKHSNLLWQNWASICKSYWKILRTSWEHNVETNTK